MHKITDQIDGNEQSEMGIYDRNYYRDDETPGFSLNSLGSGRSMVMILIGINVAVFIVDAIFPGGPGATGRLSDFLMLYERNALEPWNWWRFLTYGFAHAGPRHLIGNMIGLFFFGRTAEAAYGSRKFLWMYLTAIIAGSVIWMLATCAVGLATPNHVPGALLGASGGVVAVVILFCLKYPHQKIYLYFVLGIPAWVVGAIYVGADLLGMFGVGQEGVAFLVHLVGAAYAYVFLQTGWELSQILPGGLATGDFSIPNPFKSTPKLRVHNPGASSSNKKHQQLEQKADEILEKLHREGESSLTARERKILEDYSRSIKQKNQ